MPAAKKAGAQAAQAQKDYNEGYFGKIKTLPAKGSVGSADTSTANTSKPSKPAGAADTPNADRVVKGALDSMSSGLPKSPMSTGSGIRGLKPFNTDFKRSTTPTSAPADKPDIATVGAQMNRSGITEQSDKGDVKFNDGSQIVANGGTKTLVSGYGSGGSVTPDAKPKAATPDHPLMMLSSANAATPKASAPTEPDPIKGFLDRYKDTPKPATPVTKPTDPAPTDPTELARLKKAADDAAKSRAPGVVKAASSLGTGVKDTVGSTVGKALYSIANPNGAVSKAKDAITSTVGNALFGSNEPTQAEKDYQDAQQPKPAPTAASVPASAIQPRKSFLKKDQTAMNRAAGLDDDGRSSDSPISNYGSAVSGFRKKQDDNADDNESQ